MLRLLFLVTAVMCCFNFAGCDMPEQKRPVATPGGIDIDTGSQAPVAQSLPESDSSGTQNAEVTPAPPSESRKTAEVGDGKKGHYQEQFGRMSVFERTIGTMYRMQEKMDYQMVTHAMNLYKATNGHFPKTHDEFMKEIIEFNKIKLPELKEGCRYEYNPQEAVLEIVYPLGERL